MRSQNSGQRSASRALRRRIDSAERATSRQSSSRPPSGSGTTSQGSGQSS